jgi:hypothetical protein
MGFKMNSKGSIGVWIYVMFIVFIAGFVYIMFSSPWSIMYNKAYSELDVEYQPTADKINSIWMNWPILIIMSAIFTGVVMTYKGSNDSFA